MSVSEKVCNEKILDARGRDILSFEDAWLTPPYDIQTMINAYKAGMIGKAREVLDHMEDNLNLFDAAVEKKSSKAS